MHEANTTSSSRSNSSQRIIAAGIVFGFLYFASSIIVTLFLAVLIAYFLDPIVELMERFRIHRALGALLVVMAVMSLFAGLGYVVIARADQFVASWPRYSVVIKRATAAIDSKLNTVEKQVESITPAEEGNHPTVQVAEPAPVRAFLFNSVGSLYSGLFAVTFLPFLVFFMLAAKQSVWRATMELFPVGSRTKVKTALDQVSVMLRSYLAGNALVALILIIASWAFFLAIHLDYPFLAGCASGLFNLVPYVGAVLTWLPPFMIGIAQWNTIGPFLGVAAVLGFFHLIGFNVLMPAIVGKRVHLNALAVTISLLFWGWMWGAVGLILAIPITAVMKVICDNMDGWEAVGRWLGA